VRVSDRWLRRAVILHVKPCSPLRVNILLAACFILVSCLDFSSILKTETICSSERLIDFQRISRRYIPEGRKKFGQCAHTFDASISIGFLTQERALVLRNPKNCLPSLYLCNCYEFQMLVSEFNARLCGLFNTDLVPVKSCLLVVAKTGCSQA
jgi:hypothetical protein